MRPGVAVVVPVLGRPARVPLVIANVAETTEKPYRLLFVASEDDTDEIEALTQAGADFITVPKGRGSWACKVNDGFRATDEPWVFTGADDLKFHPGWFDRALVWAGPDTRVIGTNDICNHRVMTGLHSTHSLFRRDYVEAFGTIDQPGKLIHEGYPHQFADDEAVMTAKARGVYVHAYDSIVEHLHPLVGKAPDDATYRKGRARTAEGQRLFAQRRKLWTDETAVRLGMVPVPQRAVVVTATYGGVDAKVRPPVPQDMSVEYVCFTDREDLSVPPPWRREVRPGLFGEDARMNAKVPKMLPDVDCPDVVWVDASHEITSRSFVREALACRRNGIAVFSHPRRDCVYTELTALRGPEGQNRYADRPLDEQEAAYRAEGYPEHAGLYSGGTIAWDLREAGTLGDDWLRETEKWSHHDQVELPVVLRRLGIEPGIFPIPQIDPKLSRGKRFLANRWLRIHGHTIEAAPPGPKGVSVLIPFASDDPDRLSAFRYVCDHYRKLGYEVCTGTCEGQWSKGAAVLDAYRKASHDVLVVADADCFVSEAHLAKAVLEAQRRGWAVPHSRIWRLGRLDTKRILGGAAPRPHVGHQSLVLGGGTVVLTREAFETVGGIDPRFFGWGGEDISFGWALETLAGRPYLGQGNLFHLWHTPEERKGLPASDVLAGRYRRARNSPEEMRAIIEEALVR